MASTSDIFCGICDVRGSMILADHWCPECEEGLCSDCQKQYHRISKSTRHHEVIATEGHKKLSQYVSNISKRCSAHDMIYTHYCTVIDALCCPECILTIHKECLSLLSLREIIKTSKTTALLISLERSLSDIEGHINIIIKDREENLAKLGDQRQKFYDNIKQIRGTINSHLDKMEQNIIEELQLAEGKSRTKIENLLTQLSKEKNNVQELQTSITAVREYASDLQAFLASKSIQREVEKQEHCSKCLHENLDLQQIDLVYSPNDKLNEIVATINSWGLISAANSTPIVKHKTEKNKEAHITSVQPHTSVLNVINLQLQTSVKIKKSSNITGCCVLPSGRMIFADDQRLIVTTSKGKFEKYIQCNKTNGPYDVTVIDNLAVAVSTERRVLVINVNNEQIERKIKTSGCCYGISFNKGALLWCEEYKGICKIQLPDGNITILVKQDNLRRNSYLASYGDKIYQTNENTKTVTCYTVEGEKIWKYKDKSILGDPTGIAIDSNGNIYITSYVTNTLVLLSADGKQGRELFGQKDGMKKPCAIYFDYLRNVLLVSNALSEDVFLFNVT